MEYEVVRIRFSSVSPRFISVYLISEKSRIFKCAKMSRVQVHKVRKKLQKTKGQKNSPKKPKKPCETRLFGIGCFFDL